MPSAEDFVPIKLVEVVADEIGTPRGNGTAGSGLYQVPFRLSRTPPPEWSTYFIEAWNHPSRFTTMHRPGIASVIGDRVILNGTTIEEVEKYHRDTLLLAASEANEKYVHFSEARVAAQKREAKRVEEHQRDVREKAKRVRFEDE
jgi:hypothetical protein